MASYHRGGVRRGWRGGGGFQQSSDGGGGNRGGRGGRGGDGGGGNRGGRGGRGGDLGGGNRDGRGGRGGNRGGHGGRGGDLQRSGDEAGGSESERHVVRQGGRGGGGAYQDPAGRGGGRGGRGSGGNSDNVYNHRGGGGGAYQYPAGRGGGREGRGSGGNNGNVYNRGGGQRQDGGREGVVDYFGDGRSSQRADLRQAEPPLSLEERCSEEAATRRKEFREMYAASAKPTFPPRPGYGVEGTRCTVRANHFYVRLADKVLHHYDVTISPEPRHKDVCREVLSKLVSERQQTDLEGRLPAYDGRRSLYTAAKLPFDSKQFEVTLTDNNSKRKERNYTVVVNHATEISLHQLWTLLAGCSTDIPGQALQVLDVVLRDIVLNECNDMEYIAVGQSFFSEHIGGVQDKSLGLGIAYWKGFYQSVRPTQNGLSLIADISSTDFIKPLLLTEFAKEVLKDIDGKIISRRFTDDEHATVQKALKGVRIEVTHRGDERRKYRVTGLSLEPASELSFVSSSGEVTVMEYFRDKYNLELKHGFLPCVQIGSEQNRSCLPMEVCKIVPRQRYLKNLNEVQASNLMKSTCQHPSAREESIRQVIERNNYNSTKLANEFGIEVDNNPTEIEARVLLPPTLKYCDSGHGNTCRPRNGKWNMANKKVVNGASVRNWLCVNFCHDLSQHVVDRFCSELAERSRATGVRFPNLELPPIFTSHPNQVEADIRKFCEEAQMRLQCQKIDLLLAILPYSNRSLYGNIKRICETEIGIKSQCCLKHSILKMNINFVPNVIIKINAKAGGRNSVFLNTEASLPIVSNKPTIIFGADVTHPDALDDSAPSIAAVVASQDWPEVVKYNGVVRAQGHREEIISGLEDIVKELLCAFGEENTKKPQQLIFYRDGVGEGQFKQVLEKEIPEIEKAWKALYNNEKPHITFIVVQKRHHTRLFPCNYNDRCYIDNQGNVNPGTVVDQKICHPTEFDFFMCSHAAGPKTRGTSRPVHYHVLRDDNKFTADQLQSLTNNLCYTYPCCTRSISVAPPVHYAHKLAARARCYLTQGHGGGAAAPAGGPNPNPLPAIKDEVKRSMFYL